MYGKPYKRGFNPSEEQAAIIAEMAKAEYPGACHLTSFSTDAADQLAVGLPEGTTSSSTYAMGLRCAKRQGMARKLDTGKPSWKYTRILSEFLQVVGFTEKDRWPGMRQDMMELCSKARLSLFREMNETTLLDLADHFGIDIPWRGRDLTLNAVNYMLKWGLVQTDEFDYVDMVWIPPMKGMIEKLYEHLIVDEYQDMGLAQQEICYRIARKIIAIGDPFQAIYGFIGADANATATFLRVLGERARGVKELPLTYTRRCPHSVVAVANRWVPELKALPEAPEGTAKKLMRHEFDPMKLTPTDMLICPTNAPLISLMFALSKLNIKAFVRKTDVVDGMIRFIKGYEAKGIEALRASIEGNLEKWSDKNGRTASVNVDKFQCLKEIADECTEPSQVIRTINGMFIDKEMPGIIRLSTVHRAKGLEAKRVIFWEYDRVGRLAKMPWEKQQATNLRYVGVTRAMDTLLMVNS